MRTFNKKFISLITCLVCTTALTACQQSGLLINTDEKGESYTLSNEIIIPTTKLRSINPITSIDEDFYYANKLIYSSLIILDDTMAPEPVIASSWTFGNGTVRFKLKEGIKFSDGSELGARDIVFSFNALKSTAQSSYNEKISHIKSAYEIDNSTVEFSFVSPANASISYFDFPIISASQFSSVSDCLKTNDSVIYGTGQYQIDSIDMTKKITLIPNENYFGKKAENNITLSIMPVADPYVGLIKSGDISIYISKRTDRDEISGDAGLSVTTFISNEFETLGFNCSADSAFNNVNLRKAVACMIDCNDIIRTGYYNSGIKSDDLYFPGYYGTETNEPYKANDDRAKEYLASAGYSDTDGDGLLEDTEGKKLSAVFMINPENPSRVTAANIIAAKLRDFGIIVNIKQVESASFEGTLRSGSYDLFIGGWRINDDYDLRQFYHSGYNNYAHYFNETLNGYLDHMQSGINSDEMTDTLKKAKSIIEEDVPYICLLYKTYAAATSADFEGLVAPRANNYYYACDDWKIKIYSKEESEEDQPALTEPLYE